MAIKIVENPPILLFETHKIVKLTKQIEEFRRKGVLLTVREASERYEIPYYTLKDWVKYDKIPSIRVSPKVTLVKAADVIRYKMFYIPRENRRKD
jgi:hypothetical protein